MQQITTNIVTQKQSEMAISNRKKTRQQIFLQNRPTKKQYFIPSYLSFFTSQWAQIIINSLKNPIDTQSPLPQLNTLTISYYRRLNLPVFLLHQNGIQNPHLLHQSLWILSNIDSQKYNKQFYVKIVEQFENNFSKYFQTHFPQISEMAILVAGNKIIGKQEDIIKICISNGNNCWVLANHVYQNRINFIKLFRFIVQYENLDCIECLYHISKDNQQVGQALVSEQYYEILQRILQIIQGSNKYSNPQKCIMLLRLLGVICEHQDYSKRLIKSIFFGEGIFNSIKSDNNQIRGCVYQLLQRMTKTQQCICNYFYQNEKIIQKLLSRLGSQSLKLKVIILQIMNNLLTNGNWLQSFDIILNKGRLIEIMQQIISMNNNNNELVLGVVKNIEVILLLGQQQFGEQGQQNIIKKKLKERNWIKIVSQIQNNNKNTEICELVEFIIDKLQQNVIEQCQ